MRTFTQNLAAGVPARFEEGYFFYLFSASSPVDLVFYANNNATHSQVEGVRQGFKFKTSKKFFGVSVVSAAAQSITVIVSESSEIDIQELTGTVTALLTSPNTIESAATITLGTGANTTILAANSDTRGVLIRSSELNADKIRIGDTNITTARGMVLMPGESLTLDTAAAVYGRAVTGTPDIDILVLKNT